MKTGLILEGGAMRGLFTAGVIDVLLENNITVDGAIGVSAGAAFGCNYKSKQIGRALRYNKRFCNDKRYCGFYSLITDGNIYSKKFCYGDVPLKYDKFDFETYKTNPMDFYVVCTDIVTGEAVYHNFTGDEESRFEWIRASASLPMVSEIVEIDGMKLLDGGMADSIPIKYFESIGYDRNIVILTQPYDFEKKKNGMMPVIRMLYRKYPGLINAMEKRHTVYNETLQYIKEKEKKGELLVLRPKEKLPVNKIEKNPDNLQKAYDMGRKEAEERLCEIINYLK